jgi:hypothetical protein
MGVLTSCTKTGIIIKDIGIESKAWEGEKEIEYGSIDFVFVIQVKNPEYLETVWKSEITQ